MILQPLLRTASNMDSRVSITRALVSIRFEKIGRAELLIRIMDNGKDWEAALLLQAAGISAVPARSSGPDIPAQHQTENKGRFSRIDNNPMETAWCLFEIHLPILYKDQNQGKRLTVLIIDNENGGYGNPEEMLQRRRGVRAYHRRSRWRANRPCQNRPAIRPDIVYWMK